LKFKGRSMAEGSAASITGSRRALSRSRLRRLPALSRRAPQPVWHPWLRRSALGICPGPLIAQDSIENGQHLAHGGDEGEAGGFAGLAPTAVDGFERRVVPDGDKAGHVERCPDLDAAALDLALAAISAAVPVHWGNTDQRGNLVAVDTAQLRQFGDQGAGDDIANAGHAFAQILFGAPEGAGFDQLVNRLVDARPLGFEALEHGLERALRNSVASLGEALLFGIDHDHQPAPPRHQLGKPHREIIGQRPYGWPHGLGEVGDHRGHRVSLGQPANGAGELAHLARVDERRV
jgi:hypothetical protein